MPKRKKQAGEPADLSTLDGFTESQKAIFTAQGLKPYISHNGKVKWLSDEQYLYKQIKHNPSKRLFSSNKPFKLKSSRRNGWSQFLKMVAANWILVILVIVTIIVILDINDIITKLSLYF